MNHRRLSALPRLPGEGRGEVAPDVRQWWYG